MQQILHNPLELPDDLPVPVDDGAADHLTGLVLPDIALAATDGARVNLSRLSGRTGVYIYPRTGRPDLRGRRNGPAQTHGAGDRRRRDRQGVLSGVPARPQRRGGRRLATRRIAVVPDNNSVIDAPAHPEQVHARERVRVL